MCQLTVSAHDEYIYERIFFRIIYTRIRESYDRTKVLGNQTIEILMYQNFNKLDKYFLLEFLSPRQINCYAWAVYSYSHEMSL
jgi:hypothetical protein